MNPPMMILVSPKYRKIEIKLSKDEFEIMMARLAEDQDKFVERIIGL